MASLGLLLSLVAKCIHQALQSSIHHNQIRQKAAVGFLIHPYPVNNLMTLDFLQVAIDVSGNGKLDLPPYESGFATGFHNITIFLSSYTTGKNLTISNGTATSNNASLGDIMQQESGGTVKHVNWAWPDCLVGNGQDTIGGSRGEYNVSSVLHLITAETNVYRYL